MQQIQAKMKCSKAERNEVGESITLHAVYSEDKNSENYSYSAATPSATVAMFISNPAAIGAFEVGKEYYVDFRPAA